MAKLAKLYGFEGELYADHDRERSVRDLFPILFWGESTALRVFACPVATGRLLVHLNWRSLSSRA
jgi:hypothetical protein